MADTLEELRPIFGETNYPDDFVVNIEFDGCISSLLGDDLLRKTNAEDLPHAIMKHYIQILQDVFDEGYLLGGFKVKSISFGKKIDLDPDRLLNHEMRQFESDRSDVLSADVLEVVE